MASAPSLKDQLFALCDKHDLVHISIDVYVGSDGDRWIGASVQANHSDKRLCTAAHRGEPADCLTRAIESMNAKRTVAADVPELEAA